MTMDFYYYNNKFFYNLQLYHPIFRIASGTSIFYDIPK